MSEVRAILVSDEQRNARRVIVGANASVSAIPGWVAMAFDAAGDQPRIRVCVNPSHARPNGWSRPVIDERCFAYRAEDPCRVEDAIVLVVPRSS